MEKHTEKILEFDRIKKMLEEYAVTEAARDRIQALEPELSQLALVKHLRETSEAEQIIKYAGMPPLQETGEARKALGTAEKDGLLYPEQLERMQVFAASCGRLIRYLKKACEIPVNLGYYAESMDELEEVRMEINRCIRGSMVDDNALITGCFGSIPKFV